MEGSKCQGPERTFDPPHAETPAALPLGDAEQRRLSSHYTVGGKAASFTPGPVKEHTHYFR
jgi:hypothetical protein